jgi:hypothetical protein
MWRHWQLMSGWLAVILEVHVHQRLCSVLNKILTEFLYTRKE